MRKITLLTLTAAALAILVSGTAFAGGDHHCTKSAQECLNAAAAKYAKHGWLGIETEKDHGAYRITAVTPGSPAEAAGFRAGDTLVALEGVALAEENHEQLKKIKKGLSVGSKVKYTVARGGSKRELTATLAEVPRTVLAAWIGEHMLEHHVEGMVAQVD